MNPLNLISQILQTAGYNKPISTQKPQQAQVEYVAPKSYAEWKARGYDQLYPESDKSIKPKSIPTPSPTSVVNRLTYYLPTGSLTSTGTKPKSGYTAAISPDLEKSIPFGSLIKLPNGQTVRVEDRTNKRLRSTLDLFYGDKASASYPKGKGTNIPFTIVGRDINGLRYNY